MCTLYLSTGPWPVVAGIVYAVVAAAIMFVLYCRKPKKPNADDVEGKSPGLPPRVFICRHLQQL